MFIIEPPTPPPHLNSGYSGASYPTTVENEVNGAAVLGIALAGSAAIGLGMSAVVERKRPASGSFSYVAHSARPAQSNV
ncbi:MAG TPA: hypothetical protein V6C65_13220, partial [Allocoleopsis sp.]